MSTDPTAKGCAGLDEEHVSPEGWPVSVTDGLPGVEVRLASGALDVDPDVTLRTRGEPLQIQHHFNSLYGPSSSLGERWNLSQFGELKDAFIIAPEPLIGYGSIYSRRTNGVDMVWGPPQPGHDYHLRLAGNFNTMYADRASDCWEEQTANGRLLSYQKYAECDVVVPPPPEPLITRWFYGHLTSSRDLNGNTSYFFYDDTQRLAHIDDPVGRSIYFEYDDDGYLDALTDWAGRTHYYEHDNYGHLTQQTGPEGCITSYEYASDYRMTSMTDPDGYTTYYNYEWGPLPYMQHQSTVPYGWKVSSIISATGGATYYHYDKVIDFPSYWGGATTIIDVQGNPTYYQFDIHHHLTSVKSGTGVETQQSWDISNVHFHDIDPNGNATYYTTDYYGNRTRVKDALGQVTYYNYNVTNPKGNRLREVIDPLLHSTQYDYDEHANLIAETDALGHTAYYAMMPMASWSPPPTSWGPARTILMTPTATRSRCGTRWGGRPTSTTIWRGT